MFSVPGWSVSTSDLKPQSENSSLLKKQPEAPTASVAEEGKESDHSTGQGAKKRKRGDGVNKSNLDEMFKRHIEGYDDSNKNKKSKKNKKKNNKDKDKDNGKNNTDVKHKTQEKKLQDDRESKPNKKQKNNGQLAKKHANGDAPETNAHATVTDNVSLPPAVPPAAAKLTPLQQKMREKLMSARFRHLNETLYTTPSQQALAMFDANPELFTEYHNGFSRQVKESWPSNPVHGYIETVRKRGAVSPAHPNKKHSQHHNDKSQTIAGSLPRRPSGVCTIADLGCGDAEFARSLTLSAKSLQLKLLSYDLHAPDSLVTKADIANLPVADGSVDITIFCLSLMGTNWISFVEEAWRVLRGDGKGECWVSEVKSRFGKVSRKKAQIGLKKEETLSNTQRKKMKKTNKKKNGDNSDVDDDENDEDGIYAEDAQQSQSSNSNDTDISTFVEVFKSRGFILKQESVDKSNKMFVKMEFVKASGAAPTKGKYAGVTPARVEKQQAAVQTKKRFIDRNDESSKGLTAEQEAKALKPCVYKIR